MPVRRFLPLLVFGAAACCGCAERTDDPVLDGQTVRISFLHTADIHSRLLPYDMTVLASDRDLGLLQENAPFGGVARIAHIIQRERARAERVVYVDSGDCFQGAPIFNVFHGAIEQRALSQLRPDAVVIGNHEFDEGLWTLVRQLRSYATYPLLAANYLYVPGNPLAELSRPYHIGNFGGLRVAFIGIANFSSLSSITDVGNSLGILPMENGQILQEYIDFLTPNVDLIVGVSHAGLTEDEEIIRATRGFDVIFGGHLHVALSPPKVIEDRAGRRVPLVHSGAFAKYVGKLDLMVRKDPDPRWGWEVVDQRYTLFPVDASLPEDATMLEVLEPYALQLQQTIDLTSIFGYASQLIRRFGLDGGDSPLGNLVAESIRFQARADFGMTNTLGIRTDVSEGPITLDSIFNVFPFNNTVTTMFLSGVDVQVLLDYVSERSAGRGCNTQIQVSGIEFEMHCSKKPEGCDGPCAKNIHIVSCSSPDVTDTTGCTREPLRHDAIYEMATNDYIAGGGSGFTMLKSNNTQFDTGLPLRDAVLEAFERSPSCASECLAPDGRVVLDGCGAYEGCVSQVTAFHVRACRNLDTTDLTMKPSGYCGFDDQGCEATADCAHVEDQCAGGACQTCRHSNECDPAGCQGGPCSCVSGLCVSARARCVSGRCRLRCQTAADCPMASTEGAGLQLCVDGGCVPAPAAACVDDATCNPSILYCFGGGAPCDADPDCGAGMACVDRRCAPARTACATDGECAAGTACRFGWCQADAPCAGCAGRCVDDRCQETCSGCAEDAHCPDGQACVRGLCIPLLAQCVEHRCRARCESDPDCPDGAGCAQGLCRPLACLEPRDARTRCELKAESLDSERCLSLPCPRSRSDGRITPVVPPNEVLPSDLSPDDPDG